MNVLFDTNVVLDLLLERHPFSYAAAQLFAAVERQQLIGYLCGTTVTTVYYLAQKSLGHAKAKKDIQKLLQLFQVASVDKNVLDAAVQSPFSDFEDAVLYEAARQIGVEAIVTRNEKDFTLAELTIYSPVELTAFLAR